MDAGALVPDEVVVGMVKARLAQPDAAARGWLLDGYPRSGSQAEAIEREGIRPDVFLLLEVPDELLVERVVGRRMDPQTGAIYHLKHNPPPAEAAGRLVQRSDDTEEKAVARLATHHRNVDAVMGYYADKCVAIKGDRAMAEVFGSVERALDDAIASAPLEQFCEGNPSEPECRVYDD
jgi:adenylate kinase